METALYVDVLLALNYLTTLALLMGMSKLLGIRLRRRRVVLASLLGAASSLIIFLPFVGFFAMLVYRLAVSGLIVMAALPWEGLSALVRGWGVFFAVNFFFAGVMLALWTVLTPSGMIYYNGVVYFDINPLLLLSGSVAAYLLLGVVSRFSRSGRLVGINCRAQIKLGGKVCSLPGLVDTGNSLYEPFSGIPVIICPLNSVAELLEPKLYNAIKSGDRHKAAMAAGTRLRIIPFAGVGGSGTLPALRVDELITQREGQLYKTELCYMAISTEKSLEGGRVAILNPDLTLRKLRMECGVSL